MYRLNIFLLPIVKNEAAPPVEAFVHVIGHPDHKHDSPKSESFKENLQIEKQLEQSNHEVGIS